MTATLAAVDPVAATRTQSTGHQEREHYIDHLRTVLTMQVIVFHCAITYGSIGGWFYREIDPSPSLSSALLGLFCITSQAYFMGFFFLLAGYFTPGSLDKKGYRRFLQDRLLRLGVPLLFFAAVLGPVTIAMSRTADGRSFWATIDRLWREKDFINGPMWFAQALLIFAAVYCAGRALARSPLQPRRTATPVPSAPWWIGSAIAVGAFSALIRVEYPAGINVFGLQLAFFSSYIFLFALGIAAWRHDWLRQLTWRKARWWILSLPLLWALMPVHLSLDRTHDTWDKVNFAHGMPWAAIFWAMWEPFVAWGFIAAFLLAFRRYVYAKTALWSWLDRRAYTAFIIHPVVLVGVSLLLRGWIAPALIKWACAGSIAVAACWLISDPLVRLPGLRRIL
jgi:peptidoglycan/LPS O-acetylase OafA/YrhL